MWCKCGKDCRCMKLCPVSFGLAVGIVGFFVVLVWSLWVMTHGLPPEMVAMHMPVPSWSLSFAHALLALLKGFVGGFLVALIYDLIVCCKCRKSENKFPEND
jgi:hypothetical protein